MAERSGEWGEGGIERERERRQAGALNGYGLHCKRAGDAEAAEAAYRLALRADPHDPAVMVYIYIYIYI